MPAIWTRPISCEILHQLHEGTAVRQLGIEFTEVGDDFIAARVPVDARTRQPYGLLHGGVSVVLAETLGSCGAAFTCPEGHRAVGLDINANHLKGATQGWVTGLTRPVHIGRSTQVWHIDLRNDAGELTCVSRITLSVLAPRAK
ncbi:hotdog fold thioesterase [Hydrogenophaga sp. YM1]|uniref:hotdog fold thioesterase n=1 Tax=Hydrogenophaga TaxID=47420 RepID=UPI0008691686|nr:MULTISPECIES: hotdog fold thioesterase [unclassified Hydrogenophaga]MBN9370158.1 hotdog fold thioesterase [Hydrogenophaga sp.]ODT34224.1 MAG: esterase [Hydrogenophaga sp. SCN 70-13]OJV50014.1 MAG: esterase [Hydrogenophaga sp. 70-12]QRR34471.1 hotdog fold thioesterase [Hydrogenophaga sp. YM1]